MLLKEFFIFMISGFVCENLEEGYEKEESVILSISPKKQHKTLKYRA